MNDVRQDAERLAFLVSSFPDLEESFQAYKEGVSLVQLCNEQIDRVEKEVRVLSQEGEADEQL